MTLTHARLLELLHYDPLTGVFTRRARTCNRVKVGDVAGSPNTNGYLQISLENRLYLVSRIAVFYMTGKWPRGIVDHKNTITTDNRWENLRDATHRVNSENLRCARKDNQNGLLGVSPRDGRFRATIQVGGKKRSLGDHQTPEEAHAAYLSAKRRFHEGCTL